MVGKLSKEPLAPMELDALSSRFPNDDELAAAIQTPEAARETWKDTEELRKEKKKREEEQKRGEGKSVGLLV